MPWQILMYLNFDVPLHVLVQKVNGKMTEYRVLRSNTTILGSKLGNTNL